MSAVSSGWNAATRKRPSRASTGWPSTSASTSTSGPASSIHGARMKTARSGSSRPASVEVGLERRDLPPEGVPPHAHVDEAEVVAVEHDHPGARAEDRPARTAHRLVEPVEAHQARERRRLAARDHEAVEAVELLRLAHLDHVRAEAAQHRRVLAEGPLHGQNADPGPFAHRDEV